QRAVNDDLAGTDQLQHAFHGMCEFNDGVEIDGSGRTLDGMGGAEHGVDQLAILRSLFELQQGGLHCTEQLTAFSNESLPQHFHPGGHGRSSSIGIGETSSSV